jgi:hypothetical protein
LLSGSLCPCARIGRRIEAIRSGRDLSVDEGGAQKAEGAGVYESSEHFIARRWRAGELFISGLGF